MDWWNIQLEKGMSWASVNELYEVQLEASKTVADKAADLKKKQEEEKARLVAAKKAEEERKKREAEVIAQKAASDAKELAMRFAKSGAKLTGSCTWVSLQKEAIKLQGEGCSNDVFLTQMTPGRKPITVGEALPGCLAAKKGTCPWCCPESALAARGARGGYGGGGGGGGGEGGYGQRDRRF